MSFPGCSSLASPVPKGFRVRQVKRSSDPIRDDDGSPTGRLHARLQPHADVRFQVGADPDTRLAKG